MKRGGLVQLFKRAERHHVVGGFLALLVLVGLLLIGPAKAITLVIQSSGTATAGQSTTLTIPIVLDDASEKFPKNLDFNLHIGADSCVFNITNRECSITGTTISVSGLVDESTAAGFLEGYGNNSGVLENFSKSYPSGQVYPFAGYGYGYGYASANETTVFTFNVNWVPSCDDGGTNVSVTFEVDNGDGSRFTTESETIIEVQDVPNCTAQIEQAHVNATDNPDNTTTANLSAQMINRQQASNFDIITWSVDGIPLTVARLPFEGSSSGTSTKEYSSEGTAAVSGATYHSTGGFEDSGYYSFEKTDSITIPHNSALTPGNLTISMWLDPKPSVEFGIYTQAEYNETDNGTVYPEHREIGNGDIAELGPQHRFAWTLDEIGDYDGDGINEIIASTNHQDGSDNYTIYVIFLNASGNVKKYTAINRNNPSGNEPTSGRLYGWIATAIGDLDGNGARDIVTTTNETWIILYMNTSGHVISSQENTYALTPGDIGNPFNLMARGIGDVNGDNITDLVLSDPTIPHPVDFVVWPRSGGGNTEMWVLLLDNSTGMAKGGSHITSASHPALANIDNATIGDAGIGRFVDPIGDLDDDGVPDIATSAYQWDEVFIMFLNADGSIKNISIIRPEGSYHGGIGGTQPVKGNFYGTVRIPITVPANSIRPSFGCGIGEMPDIDGDGNQELFVGACYEWDGAIYGEGYVLALRDDGSVKQFEELRRYSPFDRETYDCFGSSFAYIGDVNGDTFGDFALGKPLNNYGGELETDSGTFDFVPFRHLVNPPSSTPQVSGKTGSYGISVDDSTTTFTINGVDLEVPTRYGFHHLGATYNGNEQKIFIDGVLEASNTVGESINTTTQNLVLGSGYWGDLDDFTIFNRALSEAQLASIAENGFTTIVSQETNPREVWEACITPNYNGDGTTRCGNITILNYLLTSVSSPFEVKVGQRVLTNGSGQDGNPLLTIGNSTLGTRFRGQANFVSGNVDLTGLIFDATPTSTVINTSGTVGLGSTFSLFVPDTGEGVTICPGATTISSVNRGCPGRVFISPFQISTGENVSGYTAAYEEGYIRVDGLTGTGITVGGTTKLVIYDEEDPEGGAVSKVQGDTVLFTANYTNATSNESIQGTCNISIATVVSDAGMTFNLSGTEQYTYNVTIDSLGNITWNVTCTNTVGFDNLTATDYIILESSAPVPEFSTIALLAALMVVVGGFLVLRKK
ncbi:hypothetical protein GF342_03510 [Candidatus Woesearchaeota archaeon]|nr:hypothetical protein [Candidatus Woesearchaeota archaeon]